METKRYFDDSDQDPDEPGDKRMRPAPSRPSLASVVGEVVMVKNLQNLFSGLEPLLRRVVSEEVERVMRHICGRSITRCPSLRIEAGGEAGRLELRFKKRLCLPMFTGSRIVDVDGKPMEVILVDTTSASTPIPTSVPHPVRVEVVVVDGDFPVADAEDWTKEDFDNHIVRQRTGKRPLLTGEVSVTMRDGIVHLSGDIEFTDNSSWIRSRKFRVAVRAMAPPTLRIREGITEPFVVKDHRGELYKKHHPPKLEDEVWRLEKIGKDGAFHKKLSSEGINTVQEFLKLSVVDPDKLRKILGIGMSDRMWEVTLKHARNCEMGNKLYIYRGSHFTLFLNPICQVVRADINGHIILGTHFNNINNRSYIEKLVREAYARWNSLEEAEGLLNDNISLLTQVEQIPESHQASVVTYDHNDYFGDKSREAASSGSNAQMGCMEWSLNPTFSFLLENANIPFSFSGDNTTTPSASASVTDTDGPAKWH